MVERALTDPQKGQASVSSLMSDFEILHNTLVADSAVPAGYLSDFMKLEEHAHRAALRAQCRCVSVSEATASMELERYRKQEVSKEVEEQALSNQLVMLAELKPRRFRTKWQKLCYDGPAGRRDAEADLRNKSTFVFCQIS